jgi:hypothetical protein
MVMDPGGPLVPGYANFWIAVAVGWKFVGTGIIKSETKLDLIIGHGTISAASRPLNALNMDVISDVETL